MNRLFPDFLRMYSIRWQRVLEHSPTLASILIKVVLIVADGLTKEACIASYLFMKSVIRLRRKSGMLFTALYLKQCSSSLQRAYGGNPHVSGLLPFPVSLTRSGYPTIIPAFHRLMIYKKDEKADLLVRMYLSFFTLSYVIELSKKVSKSTFESIITPVENMDTKVWGTFWFSKE